MSLFKKAKFLFPFALGLSGGYYIFISLEKIDKPVIEANNYTKRNHALLEKLNSNKIKMIKLSNTICSQSESLEKLESSLLKKSYLELYSNSLKVEQSALNLRLSDSVIKSYDIIIDVFNNMKEPDVML